jgi:hypothetical protein
MKTEPVGLLSLPQIFRLVSLLPENATGIFVEQLGDTATPFAAKAWGA